MTTSWTEADITALETAIKGGVLRVRFGDREVQYHSISDMLSLLQSMKEAVASSGSSATTRCTFASFTKD
jgi:hypothetical protein